MMRPLPTAAWMDWFGSLRGPQSVVVRWKRTEDGRPHRYVLDSAEYAPFDDLIEFVFSLRSGTEWRFLVDHPRGVFVDDALPAGEWRAQIVTSQGAVELSHRSRRPLRQPVSTRAVV